MALFIILAFVSMFTTGVISSPVSTDLTERCLKTSHHMPEAMFIPTPLTNMCTPWSSFSCCSPETAIKVHQPVNNLGFDMLHCGEGMISKQCQLEFSRQQCYYNCDPWIIEPWIVKPSKHFPMERLNQVPMCESECLRWFQACADSFTCVRNWAKHMTFDQNNTKCPSGTKCLPIKSIFFDFKDFCETVENHRWKVVSDSEKCIQLSFSSDLNPNPNKAIAQSYLLNSENARTTDEDRLSSLLLLVLLFLFFLYVFKCLGKMHNVMCDCCSNHCFCI